LVKNRFRVGFASPRIVALCEKTLKNQVIFELVKPALDHLWRFNQGWSYLLFLSWQSSIGKTNQK
jgi:hypothetical protein